MSVRLTAKQLAWFDSDDTGLSSIQIFRFMTGMPKRREYLPCDAGDFGRCYRLIRMFPEWRDRLPEFAETFPLWAPIVREWSKLTRLYENYDRTKDWKIAHSIYDRLHRLSNEAHDAVYGKDGAA